MSSGLSRSTSGSERPLSADVVRVVDAIRSIIQSLRISGRAVEQQLGVSSAQLYVLQALAERPEQSINDLAFNTFTHQSSVSMVVSRLVASNLVRRNASRGDARRVSISLTPAGRALVRRAPRTAQTRLIEGLQTFSRNDLRALGDYLESIAAVAMVPVRQSHDGESGKRHQDRD